MIIILLYIFTLGCCIGSFINVLVNRLPKCESIISPRSRCLICGEKIRWYDNIPLISWLNLSGKCRNCKAPISLTYPFIEFLTGSLFVLNFYSSPTNYENIPLFLKLIMGFIFIFFCISLSALDFKYFWLPESITSLGLIFGLIVSLITQFAYNLDKFSFILSIYGGTIGYLFFIFLSILGYFIYKKPVLGGGDAKLSALLGTWLGVKGLLLAIWIAFNAAGIFVLIGLSIKKIKMNQKIPFGIFLAFSGLIVWQFGYDNLLKLVKF